MMIFDLPKQALAELSHLFKNQSEQLDESQLKPILESIIRKLNLVSREEFDTQTQVLQRTRQKLEALEKQISDLEQQLQQSTSNTKSK